MCRRPFQRGDGKPQATNQELPVVLGLWMTQTSKTNVVRSGLSCKEWIERGGLEPPSAGRVRPEKCPVCDRPAAPVGGPVRLHAHSKHRTRTITRLREFPESTESLDETDAPKLEEVTIRVRRYFCVTCETTCTVVPMEVRPNAALLRGVVVFVLAIWVTHPEEPSAEKLRNWVFPGHSTFVRGWPQLHRWARSVGQFVDGAEKLCEAVPPKLRAEQLVQICGARAPPEMREASLPERAHRGAQKSH